MPTFKVQRLCRFILILHGLANVAQGVYSILYPRTYATSVSPDFERSTDQAIQAIGLGALGVGAYSTAGAIGDSWYFYMVTAAMRLVFGSVVATQWDFTQNWGVMVYEWTVALLAFTAAKLLEKGKEMEDGN